jgi:hypothetical protein
MIPYRVIMMSDPTSSIDRSQLNGTNRLLY